MRTGSLAFPQESKVYGKLVRCFELKTTACHCRRITDLTCGDLRSLTLTPTLPLPASSSLRDNLHSTGPSLFTTEGGSAAGKSVCSGGLSPTGFSPAGKVG